MASILERDLGLWGKIIAHVDGKFIRYGDSPDFINAPPKLRLAVSLVKKWLYSQMFLCQEERFCEGCPIFGQPYPYNSSLKIQHMA